MQAGSRYQGRIASGQGAGQISSGTLFCRINAAAKNPVARPPLLPRIAREKNNGLTRYDQE
jgi:hypothetical protein